MTAPSKTVDPPFGVYSSDGPAGEHLEERVRRLEDDLVELRGVVTRFGDLFVGGQVPEPPKPVPAADAAIQALVPTAIAEKIRWYRRFASWIPFEIFRELSQMSKMYIDPRYRMRRMTQLLAPAIALMFIGAYFFFSWFFALPILSPILERLCDIVLAIALYKILHSELLRYREMLATFDNWTAWRRGGAILQGEEPHTPMEME